MKNKTQNNEKLARNIIRVRKAIRKRSYEQTTQTRRKRWQSRLLALVGCLLLVSALVVPCFADYEQPTQKPIDELVVDVGYSDSDVTTQVNLVGYYEIRISSIGEGAIRYGNELLLSHGLLDIIAYHTGTGQYLDVKKLNIVYTSGARRLEMQDFSEPNFDGTVSNLNIPASDVSSWVFYVRQYPNLAVNENQWSEFDYSVYQLVDTFEVDKVSAIWTDVMTWITNALASIQSVFYLNGSLTFLGTLAIIGVSIALGWLIIGIVTRFIQLRW